MRAWRVVTRSVVAASALVANAAPARAEAFAGIQASAMPGYLSLGEGWGCVLPSGGGQYVHQCWSAHSLSERVTDTSSAPVAWSVPWLRRVDAGADRLCGIVAEQIHCWAPPASRDTGPRELPVANSALVDPDPGTPAPRRHSIAYDSALYAGFVGADYACAVKTNELWCAGDDSFGQLGRGSTQQAGPARLHLAPLNDLAAGYWHACATGWRRSSPSLPRGRSLSASRP